MQSDMTLRERNQRVLYGVLGFGVPLFFLAAQVFFDIGSMPLMLLMLSWFGVALLVFIGISE